MPAKKATSSRTKRKTAASSKTASTKKRATAAKTKSKAKAGESEVTIDRRRADRRGSKGPEAEKKPKIERRAKVQRRRQIDPTTCERDYSNEEVEFMNAMDEYKRTSGRMFPTCSEVLEVIRGLGYTKLTTAEMAILRPAENPADAESATSEKISEEGAELETIGADHDSI